ncbi:MAG: replication factor C large subunit [Candidatus Pacearchaeota archaeon]|nr:replication factor C large subunit [Candidatus Pacearchaeota archaeon]
MSMPAIKPWPEKYRPRKLREVVGHLEAKKKIFDFFNNFSKHNQNKKALMLYGPAGVGKTAIVYALAYDYGYEIIELNASVLRNKQNVQEIVGQALKQKSFFSKGKIILIDEVDGLTSDRDRGGIQELLRLISDTRWPIVLVANDAWQAKLRPLRAKTHLVELKALSKESVFFLLQQIAKKERLDISEEALWALASLSRGDARAAITDLQSLAAICKKINKEDVGTLCTREKDENIFNALRQVFKTKNYTLGAFDNVQNIDIDEVFLWLDENLPMEYHGTELAKAYDALSKADVFRGRIRRWQHWRFLVYITALLTEGVAHSKKHTRQGFTSYKPPSRMLKIWMAKQKLARRRELADKLAKVTHASKKRAYQELPFLEIALKNSIQ